MSELFKALAKFQQEVPTIHKGTKGYGYTYADLPTILEVINPILKNNGLGFSQPIMGDCIKTILFHSETGETLESLTEIPKNVSLKGMNDFQILGSAITYLRRYALSSMLGIVTDKDIDAAGEQEKKPTLVVNSKPFHGGISKKTTIDEMKKYFTISEQVEKEYLKQLNGSE